MEQKHTFRPQISIITSTYNDGAYLTAAIESVLKQTFTNWEFIIINDASYDNTNEIITKYARNGRYY